ncbi:integrin beta-PS-like [Battus philenor]|uniref:integrin beta-PS-like n=1 Tax=Battus philenor TaxID=42288 RepID=UPI0035CF0485
MMLYNIIYIFLMRFVIVLSETGCHDIKTCGNCIGYALESCVWCSVQNFKGKRCQPLEMSKNSTWCEGHVSISTKTYKVLQNDTFNSGENGTKVVQFLPQIINVKVRPGVPVYFNMAYKPAKDYPLDVYYIMDYSYTMRVHQKKLRDQGFEIYRELTKLTNNVQLGVGSFVEKPALPFSRFNNVAYSFKNELSLTQNMVLFQNVLKVNLTGSNNDDPEAGFDALMQAMVCLKEIGWRESARRIIILATDSTYHSAGDGKFVGAEKPNDMKCHLDNNNYNMSLVFDYPSVSQINKVATENNIKIIFAAIADVKKEYEQLAKKIRGAKYVELNDGSNLVTMIKNEYLELIRSVDINIEIPPHIELSLEPDCRKAGNCFIKHNESVNINATLKVKSCPDIDSVSEVRVGPVALNEKLKIFVKTDCVCDCERKVSITNSTKCSGNGLYQCGICKCNENNYGDDCRCKGNSTTSKDLDECKINPLATQYCSGRGTCSCGKCVNCDKGFHGDHCQYDDTACPSPGGKLCAEYGLCRYGKCQCFQNRTGLGCECPLDNDSCFAAHSKEVCSGNGKCVCGECVCFQMNSLNRTCFGRFCDSCDEFAEKRCQELEDYAACNYLYNKTYCDSSYNQTAPTVVRIVDTLNETLPDQQMVKWCKKQMKNGTLIFKYLYPLSTPNTLHVIIQKELEPLPQINLLFAILVPFGVLLLIGLLTIIIWKILVDIYDAREYKNFAEKSAAAGFSVPGIVNPHYRPPAATYINTMYNQNISS